VVFSILWRKGAGRRWREGWPSKIDWNWVKHCCSCWLFKNGRRITSRMIAESLNIPKTAVLRILKEDLETESSVHVLFHTPWHLSKGKIESHLSKTSRWPMQTIFLTKILREMRPGVLPVTLKQSDRVLMVWWNIPSAEGTEIPKFPQQDHVDNFFRLSRRSAQRKQ
jgi:hypothetical protein